MRRVGAVLLLLLSVLLSLRAGQDPPAPAVAIPASATWRLASQALGRTQEVFVAWPQEDPPAAGYPLLVVLDGELMFATAVEAARLQAHAGGAPAIVVGVACPSSSRAADLAPPGPGPDRLLRFVCEELRPELARRFPIDPRRSALFGHSLGGLFVLHALFTRPEGFASYVAASPSVWWRDRAILPAVGAFEAARAQAGGDPPLRLLITVGEEEERPGPGLRGPQAAQRRAQLQARAQVTEARALAERLGQLPGLEVELQVFPGEDHPSVVPVALSRAVRFGLAPR